MKKNEMEGEKNHKIPRSIIGARHQPKSQNGTGYPITITVRMSDGQDVTYKR